MEAWVVGRLAPSFRVASRNGVSPPLFVHNQVYFSTNQSQVHTGMQHSRQNRLALPRSPTKGGHITPRLTQF